MLIKRRDKIASIYLTAVNPIVESAPRREWPADVRERRVRRRRRERRGHVSRLVDALRQRHRRDAAARRTRRARRPRSRRRAGCRPPPAAIVDGGHLRRQRRTPGVAAADPHLVPPSERRLDARRARTAAGEPANGCGEQDAAHRSGQGTEVMNRMKQCLAIVTDGPWPFVPSSSRIVGKIPLFQESLLSFTICSPRANAAVMTAPVSARYTRPFDQRVRRGCPAQTDGIASDHT